VPANSQLGILRTNIASSPLKITLIDIQQSKMTVRWHTCDLTNPQQLQNVLSNIRRDFGDKNVDILINNAGVANGKSFEDLTQKDWEKTFNVNVLAHFSLVHSLLPGMISNEYGHIVSIASVLGLYGLVPRCADYVASKFAAVGLMEAIEYELHCKGVKSVGLSTVCPYMIATPMFAGTVPSRFPNALPILTPEFVAANIVDGVKNRRRLIVLPGDFLQFPILKYLLPKSVLLAMADFSGTGCSMDKFVGRSGASNGYHNGEISNGK